MKVGTKLKIKPTDKRLTKGRSVKQMHDAPKRNEAERQFHKEEIPRLLRRGHTMAMIAEQLGISVTLVSLTYKTIRKEWAEQRNDDVKELIAVKLEEYSEIKKEAWAEWERSKKDLERITEEEKLGKADDEDEEPVGIVLSKRTTLKEARIAANGFLATVLECLRAERDLLGLDPVKEVKVEATTTTIDWNVLAVGIPPDGQPVPSPVEEEIRKALEGRKPEVITVDSPK